MKCFRYEKNIKVIVEKQAKRQMKVQGSDGGGECHIKFNMKS